MYYSRKKWYNSIAVAQKHLEKKYCNASPESSLLCTDFWNADARIVQHFSALIYIILCSAYQSHCLLGRNWLHQLKTKLATTIPSEECEDVSTSRVEQELERLQRMGVIEPVQFSEWAAPIVPVVKKDGT